MAVDWLQYIAGYADLIAAIGTDEAAAERHYNLYGRAEGRSLTAFNPLLYGASYSDLALRFGTDAHALALHYIRNGYAEGRTAGGFDPLRYGASNYDLALRYGTDSQALLEHYLTFGAKEGRPVATFDALAYGASYSDLAIAFGNDAAMLTRHYLASGAAEGRAVSTFKALEYAALNPDLAGRFGVDTNALRDHYLLFGAKEGRQTIGFDAVGYMLSYDDLRHAGLDANGAMRHWILNGIKEGRSAGDFGADQVQHTLAVGRASAGSFAVGTDKDWFQLSLAAGQTIAVSLLKSGGVGTGFSGGTIEIYDQKGQLLGSGVTGGTGFDTWVKITTATAGVVYVVADTTGAIGNYDLAVARVGAAAGQNPHDFVGGAITDVYIGTDPDYNFITGGAGDDILGGGPGQNNFAGGLGADYMEGGADISRNGVYYTYSTEAVEVRLDGSLGKGGFAEGDRLVRIGQVEGSAFDDKLYGSEGADNLFGNGGHDHIEGLGGNDILSAGTGGDFLFGGDGGDRLYSGVDADLLDGGAGYDYVDYQMLEVGVRVDLRSGLTAGGAAGDQLVSIEAVDGTRMDDVLATDAITFSALFGAGGNDILIDRHKVDAAHWLVGGSGDDLMIGGYLRGDDGNDIMVATREYFVNTADGLTGADRYVVDPLENVAGSVFDFSLRIDSFDASDKVDLSRLRDENGAILDFNDILAHVGGNVLDLTGFRTAAGDTVFGYIEFNAKPGLFDPMTPYATENLTAANFVFSGGVNWLGMLPADVPFL